MNYYPIIKPLLFALAPETAHHFTLNTLRLLDKYLKYSHFKSPEVNPIDLMGLHFPNRIGLAAGLDKSGQYIDALFRLGFGFVEIGTITPRSQVGNPKPRLFRLPKYHALINRMGFNNAGITQCLRNIQARRYDGILGINIGKNADTPLENALDDYLTGFCAFYPYADYITVNISSPNTPGLRTLQKPENLTRLLDALKQQQSICQLQQQKYVPLLLKVAPDLMPDDIKPMADILLKYKIDGLIATNTTCQRPSYIIDKHVTEQGGLSGQPLHDISLNTLKQFYALLQNQIPIIGVGGIGSVTDASDTFSAGAKLCQLYTGLIYQGPQLIRALLKQQAKLSESA